MTSHNDGLSLISRDRTVGLSVFTYHHWDALVSVRGHRSLTIHQLDALSFRLWIFDQVFRGVEILLLMVSETSGFSHVAVTEDSAEQGPNGVEPDCPGHAQIRVDHGFSAYADNC